MQLNRSTDYAIQMLVHLAKAGKIVSSSKLAASIGVSHRYLLQISAKLREAGFIRVAHGSAGGMILLKPSEEICLYEVIIGMEGIICGIPSDEVSKEMLMLKNEYRKVDRMLEQSLKEITLARIMEADKNRNFSQ